MEEMEDAALEAPGHGARFHHDRRDRRAGRTVKGQGDVTRATIYVRMKDLEERYYSQFACAASRPAT